MNLEVQKKWIPQDTYVKIMQTSGKISGNAKEQVKDKMTRREFLKFIVDCLKGKK